MATTNWNSNSFKIFFEGWLVRQEHYLDELISATQSNIYEKNETDLRDLIEKVLSHYQQYYEAKSLLSESDVYILFAPTWFSSFEQSFLWVAGFRPTLAIQIVSKSVDDLGEEQVEMMEKLKLGIRVEESELEEDMARVQESLGAPPLLEIAREWGRLGNGGGERKGIEILGTSMEILVKRADFLRMKTTMKVVEILSSVQTVKFLVAVGQIHLQIRKWGIQMDSERGSC